MLPVYSNDKDKAKFFRIRESISQWMKYIFADQNSRNLFCFLMLNFSFAFVELFYGIWTNSLGLISDSFHMFFDCTALIAGLLASVIMKWKADDRFTYGYVRAETISAFVNALFLVFVAFFIFKEAIERVLEPPEVKHERLFLISVIGLLVNLVGIFVFRHGGGHGHSHGGHGHSHSDHHHHHQHSHSFTPNHDHSNYPQPAQQTNLLLNNDHLSFVSSSTNGQATSHQHSHTDHGHSHGGGGSQIMKGVFLHILADTLGSVGVIVSAFIMSHFNLMIADPICSLFIASLILISVYPLLVDTISVLMQRTPHSLDKSLSACHRKVLELHGVLNVRESHFWTLCTDQHVGTVHLEVNAGQADPRFIQMHTTNIYSQAGVKKLTVQIDYVQM